jgi:hypothetical protein
MKTFCILAISILITQTGCAADADKKDDPAPAGPIVVTVSCDKKEYMHGEPGVVYVMAPTGKLKAKLTVKNVGDVGQTLEFRSGQQYDFIIRDAKGKELVRWSAEMGFMAVIQEIELPAGEKMEFEEELLLGAVGKPLPEGDYILEGVLTSHPPISVKIKFKIVPTPAK